MQSYKISNFVEWSETGNDIFGLPHKTVLSWDFICKVIMVKWNLKWYGTLHESIPMSLS